MSNTVAQEVARIQQLETQICDPRHDENAYKALLKECAVCDQQGKDFATQVYDQLKKADAQAGRLPFVDLKSSGIACPSRDQLEDERASLITRQALNLPPDATPQQVTKELNAKTAAAERSMFKLPPDASDADVRRAEAQFQKDHPDMEIDAGLLVSGKAKDFTPEQFHAWCAERAFVQALVNSGLNKEFSPWPDIHFDPQLREMWGKSGQWQNAVFERHEVGLPPSASADQLKQAQHHKMIDDLGLPENASDDVIRAKLISLQAQQTGLPANASPDDISKGMKAVLGSSANPEQISQYVDWLKTGDLYQLFDLITSAAKRREELTHPKFELIPPFR